MKDLEFLPEHHLNVQRNVRRRSACMLLLTAVALCMLGWTALANRAIESVQAELALVRAETAQLSGQIVRLEQLEQALKILKDRQLLVEKLNPMRQRSEVMCDLAQRLPAEIVLTRLEVELQRQVVQEAKTRTAAAASRRRGGKVEQHTETVDRLGIEGFAANDLALARFLQEMTEARASFSDSGEVTAFRRGDLSFTRDAQYRERNVRVFRATFHSQAVERSSPTLIGMSGERN